MDIKGKYVLTGVKPTGHLHLGNYVGAIKPAIQLGNETLDAGGEFLMFLADYHALNYMKNAEEMRNLTYQIACAYLACGVDPKRAAFFRQSDIPEVFEMATILTNFTPKGFMNKAHAYKAAVDKNIAKGEPNDAGINMGLYNYPVLMAADILTYGSDYVPVGKDQVQHVEITADIAGALNAAYGKQVLKIPSAITQEYAAVLPGMDGRKMSKSYGNVLPLFDGEAALKKAVMSITTDSQDINAPKNPEEILLFQIVRGFAKPEVVAEVEEGLKKGGMGYGTIKKMLLAEILEEITPLKEKYDAYQAHLDDVEDMLQTGAKRARELAKPVLDKVRKTVLGK